MESGDKRKKNLISNSSGKSYAEEMIEKIRVENNVDKQDIKGEINTGSAKNGNKEGLTVGSVVGTGIGCLLAPFYLVFSLLSTILQYGLVLLIIVLVIMVLIQVFTGIPIFLLIRYFIAELF